MPGWISQLLSVTILVNLVIGQDDQDRIQDLKDKLESLKTSKVRNENKKDLGSADISSILRILETEEKEVPKDNNIRTILSQKCKTIHCQEEKNRRVVNFLLKNQNTADKTEVLESRSKLQELSDELDKLIPTKRIQPRRKLTGKFSREQSRSSALLDDSDLDFTLPRRRLRGGFERSSSTLGQL